ncbi:hypothetical protein ES703_35048 [subsurface metagenome]
MINITFIPLLSADEPILLKELKKEVENNSGFFIYIEIITNPESKLQDLYITPEIGRTYSSGSFIYAVAQAVSNITSHSLTYRFYTGITMIDVNGELWAISAENCRKIFKLGTVEEQNAMLQKSLKRLR